MRTVKSEWRNLAQGYEKALELERSLQASWGPQVEQVLQQQRQAGLSAWNLRQGQKAHEHQRALSIWQQAMLGRRLRLQVPVGSGARQVGINVYTNQILIAVTLLLGFVDNGLMSLFVVALFIKTWIALVRTAWHAVRSGNLSSRKPWPVAKENPRFQKGEPSGLDLVEQWWQRISDDHQKKIMVAGDEGEENFFRHLTSSLPDDYVCVRCILVKERLDVDILVVGPTNVWVFEVKHWSGTISCHNGTWRRSKPYYPGEEEALQSFDRQWLHEQREVEKTLRLRVQPLRLANQIDGGLVFTHPAVSFDIDESRKCAYGQPQWWGTYLEKAANEREWTITQRSKLDILDALLDRAERIDGSYSQRRCCIELAEQLFDELTERAESYVARYASA
jgi:hypothetical protein